MAFDTVALPWSAYAALEPRLLKALVGLARYTNKEGECWPLGRQLAEDLGVSQATVSRWIARLVELGCVTRRRCAGGGRYLYTLAERFRLRFPPVQKRFAQAARQQANPSKHEKITEFLYEEPWSQRCDSYAKGHRWNPVDGPEPGQPGCRAPAHLALVALAARQKRPPLRRDLA